MPRPSFPPKSRKTPVLAVTMGDPAGIGAEVALKAAALRLRRPKPPSFLFLGDGALWTKTARKSGVRIPLEPMTRVSPGQPLPRAAVLDLGGPGKFQMGRVSAGCGAASVLYVEEGVKLVRAGVADALVTAPISKEAVHRAGCGFPGHTELLAHLTGTRDFAMMMVGGPFRITLLSIHLSLRQALDRIDGKSILKKLSLTARALQGWFGVRRPKIAVAGLNPHAGENGAFGKEEKKVIGPAVNRARRMGLDVSGPHPPDTLFHWASKGKYDAVLCLYHDQGLIPLKLAAFESGVNLTLGLPFPRTSPDHGTAFDIAGRGLADPGSMLAAMELAQELAGRGQ